MDRPDAHVHEQRRQRPAVRHKRRFGCIVRQCFAIILDPGCCRVAAAAVGVAVAAAVGVAVAAAAASAAASRLAARAAPAPGEIGGV